AAVGWILSEIFDRDVTLSNRQRYGEGAVCSDCGAGGVVTADFYSYLHRPGGGKAGRKLCLGIGCLCAVRSLFGNQDWAAGAPYYPPRTRQACRHSKYSPRNHYRPPHRKSLRDGAVGERTFWQRLEAAAARHPAF